MPCYQINRISVAFKVEHLDLLQKAAASLNWRAEKKGDTICIYDGTFLLFTIKDDEAIVDAREEETVNKLKLAYSEEALKHEATKIKLKGWTVEKKSKRKMVFVKGGTF
jgi:hypothetical protein